jgi:FtsP/CotA-like multicopper oxidase with cupredoxin domain
MFPIYVPPQYEDGPHGERILPRWIDGVCNVFADGPGNLGNKEGRCFEFPMILSEARFNNEGGQTANGDGKGVANVPAGTCRVDYEIEGNIYKADVITVNKLPWPKMKVFAGYKYRGRVLGASISRSYRLSLSGGNGCAKMIVVGTDTELLLNPVVVKFLDVNSGERYQVVFDFSNCVVPEGKKNINVHLRNANDFLNNEDYLHTDKVMRFQVMNPPAKIKNAGQPSMLASDWEGGGGVPCALDPSTMTGENAKICANAKLVPDAAPTWYKNEDVCLLSENDALLRREAVQTALRALDVVRGVEPDAYGETRVREITESRPASVDISATFSADDPKTNPNGFATLSDACHGASGQGEMTTTHAKLEVAGAVGPVQCVTVRTLIFARTGGEWVINDKTWRSGDRDAMGRIEAAAQYGCLEVWHIITGGGGWHHPVHLHLIDAWIVERKDGREDEARKAWPEGRGVFPYETGSKDVFFVGFNEHVTIAFFADSNRGNYMFHCHNLIHEDDDMLLAFTVTRETYDADAVPVSKDLVMQPPFDPRFPYQTKVTPGESTKSQGQDAHRYLFPRSTQPDGANSGLVTASGYMFEYEKLWQVQSPIRDHQVEATAAIKELFENGGKGRTGKYYEEDGKFYASGERNVAGDLLLGEDTEPSQKNRNGDIEEMFFSRY